jgi:hypothetical protein
MPAEMVGAVSAGGPLVTRKSDIGENEAGLPRFCWAAE